MEEDMRARQEEELRTKPLSKEDAYFKKVEEERLKALRERETVLKLLCPRDQTELVVENKNGIVVDRCPKCQGVWLDEHEAELLKHVMREDEGIMKRILKNLLPYQGS